MKTYKQTKAEVKSRLKKQRKAVKKKKKEHLMFEAKINGITGSFENIESIGRPFESMRNKMIDNVVDIFPEEYQKQLYDQINFLKAAENFLLKLLLLDIKNSIENARPVLRNELSMMSTIFINRIQIALLSEVQCLIVAKDDEIFLAEPLLNKDRFISRIEEICETFEY